ncbi:hypothetical protein G7Z17_g3677 [Cylindrodendrum hubeiense]|uniref:Uncharacterized protein n=1 Tax=Cylindrodendrum hubeiense TaxID=595255 RepID=A0A9P5LHX5_9HYPO|nr:hypothetical protein G7Z17_g3677 [Cylindrodendrum hubeiense]
MRLTAIIIALVGVVAAIPTNEHMNLERDTPEAITDNLMFVLTLPQFTARRNQKDPPSLDWSSDGCTSSPDNPFGFPFLPACHRHDFGYQNFANQKRFTKPNKGKIDLNFKTDLNFQCKQVTALNACQKLAEVYYLAVSIFGGTIQSKREQNEKSVAAYKAAVAAYEQAVVEAQKEGLLPVLSY